MRAALILLLVCGALYMLRATCDESLPFALRLLALLGLGLACLTIGRAFDKPRA